MSGTLGRVGLKREANQTQGVVVMSAKSNMVSGMGVALSLVQTLVASVRKAGAHVGMSEEEADKQLHRLTTTEANGVWDKIASVIVEAGKKISQVSTLVVDYGRSVKDGVAAGKYDYANDNITEENFPPAEHEKGKKEQTFTLYHFGKDVDSDYAIAQMEKRPATLRELLAFGEAHPELQRDFPIIVLGSVWVDHGRRRLAYLDGCGSGRYLSLSYDGGRWRALCRFLGVGK